MINFIDEVLASVPRYNIKDNGGTTLYNNVQIDFATQVTTQGTPLNKALFDSIQTDLTNLNNNKLNVSAKATTAQAQAGTNDTNYMTPAKTRDFANALKTSLSATTGTSLDVYTFDNNSTKIIRIEGRFGSPAIVSSSYPTITVTGSGIKDHYIYVEGTEASYLSTTGTITKTIGNGVGTASNSTCPFFFEFNMKTKTFKAQLPVARKSGSYTYFGIENHIGDFDTLTKMSISKNTNIPVNITIDEIV